MPKHNSVLNSDRLNMLAVLLAASLAGWSTVAAAQPPDPTDSDSSGNTAAGTDALLDVSSGIQNTAVGSHALVTNQAGSYNTAVGFEALYDNTGSSNTATGRDALTYNSTGSLNTADGTNALFSNTTGSDNVASGYQALLANTTGNYNAAFGYLALAGNTSGHTNVALGAAALTALTSGSNNVAVGTNSAKYLQQGSENIYIGNTVNNGNESNATRIGDKQTHVFIAGIAGVPLSGASVVIKSNGRLGVVASSARYKQDIHSMDDQSEKLTQLRPVSYQYKSEPGSIHYGLIAEEVDKVMPNLVVRDDQNRPESVQYLEIVPLLLQQWKDQRAEIAQQRETIAQQTTRLEQQSAELGALRDALDRRLAALERASRGNQDDARARPMLRLGEASRSRGEAEN